MNQKDSFFKGLDPGECKSANTSTAWADLNQVKYDQKPNESMSSLIGIVNELQDKFLDLTDTLKDESDDFLKSMTRENIKKNLDQLVNWLHEEVEVPIFQAIEAFHEADLSLESSDSAKASKRIQMGSFFARYKSHKGKLDLLYSIADLGLTWTPERSQKLKKCLYYAWFLMIEAIASPDRAWEIMRIFNRLIDDAVFQIRENFIQEHKNAKQQGKELEWIGEQLYNGYFKLIDINSKVSLIVKWDPKSISKVIEAGKKKEIQLGSELSTIVKQAGSQKLDTVLSELNEAVAKAKPEDLKHALDGAAGKSRPPLKSNSIAGAQTRFQTGNTTTTTSLAKAGNGTLATNAGVSLSTGTGSKIVSSQDLHSDELKVAVAQVKDLDQVKKYGASTRRTDTQQRLINILKKRNILVQTLEGAGFDRAMISLAQKYKEALKNIRYGYATEVSDLKKLGDKMLARGVPPKKVAQIMHEKRRVIGKKYKDLTPDEIRPFIYGRNEGKYGDNLGPTFDVLVEKGKKNGLTRDQIWKKIINSSSKPNEKLNRFIDLL